MPPRAAASLVSAAAALGTVALAAQAPSSGRLREVTFNRDVAPIIWQNCSTCHREGQLGPFSLLTSEEVRPRALDVVRVVKTRRMPPWKPVSGHGDFLGARRLSDGQISLIERWVKDGTHRGDPVDLADQPSWASGWQL